MPLDPKSESLLNALDKVALISISDSKGTITYINDNFSNTYKYKREEILGKNHNILKSSYHNPEYYQDLWNTVSTGMVWHGEFKNLAKDKTENWVDTYITPIVSKLGRPTEYISIGYLINDKKRVEVQHELHAKDLEDLKKATLNLLEDLNDQATELKKFKEAVDNASDHIVITDLAGTILYANPAVHSITGYKQNEVLGKKAGAKDLWGGLMPKEFYQDLWHTISVLKKPYLGTIKNRRKNGKEYYAYLSVTPIFDEQNNTRFYVGIERDITREREIDRMKTEFISLASHQLRTPLSAMKWFLELLLSGDAGKLKDEQLDYVKNISQSNERMIELVNSLLNISRIESGRLMVEPIPTKIDALLNSVLTEVKNVALAKKIKIIVSSHPNIPEINIDPKLITEVFVSLLSNAIKYTPEGGEVSILLSEKDTEVVCQISDTGIGIPSGEGTNLFSKFFRASNAVKNAPDGTGLGLYLAKTIIESSQGKLWFESKENQGSTFWFTLPKAGMRARKGDVRLNT